MKTLKELQKEYGYPEDKNGDPSLPGLEPINIRNVRGVINKISTILNGANAMIDEYLSINQNFKVSFAEVDLATGSR